MENRKLEAGEKYLSVSIGASKAGGGIRLALFKNKNKRKPTDPDYTGSVQVAAWISTKKEKTQLPSVNDL